MLELSNYERRNGIGLTRRKFMSVGSSMVGGFGLADLLRMKALGSEDNSMAVDKDTAVIFVWLPGGPPHMEMYDMKPEAPSDYRGIFSPIRTNVSGIDVCELLPMHARIADKFNIIRSIHHGFADHGGGHKRFLTGRKPATPTGFVNDAPCVGSMASKALEPVRQTQGLPNYIVLGNGRVNNVDTFSFGSSYLGTHTHPFRISSDPNSDNFTVKNVGASADLLARLEDRRSLLGSLDTMRRDVESSGVMESMDVFNRKAMQMMTSSTVREAFDMSQESDSVRERFGRHEWGQRAILARRLVERGVPWVTVVMENPYCSGIKQPDYGVYNWDSHAVNCHIFDDARIRFPIYDQTITAMVEDLYARGLDKKVMLVVTGEFGRTPRITVRPGSRSKVNQPGRDHWPRAMSMLVSGGGMRTGQVIGATNSRGEEPIDRAMSPNDLWATVFHHLGVNYRHAFLNHNGRPMPILPHGSVIPELV